MAPKSLFSIAVILIFVCCVSADYQLLLTIYSYDNPENKCADCRDSPFEEFGCCDNRLVKNGSECALRPRPCEIVLSVCLRQPTSRVSDHFCPAGNSLHFSGILRDTNFDPPLSIVTTGPTWDTAISQMYITLLDDDFGGGYQLVDSFPTNLTAGTRISRQSVTGQFGLATVELELSLVCINNFYGADCSRLCERPPCACDPGFTGEFCETDIDECASVDCSGRGVCLDGVNSYTCTCGDGYSGTNCEVNTAGAAVGIVVAILVVLTTVTVLAVIIFISLKRKKVSKDYSVEFTVMGNQTSIQDSEKSEIKFYKGDYSSFLALYC